MLDEPNELTREVVTQRGFTKRQFSLVQLTTQLVLGGYVENPDEVLRQFGSYEGVKFYLRMYRQFPFLVSPVSQRIDPVISAERQWIAGDANSEISVQMAKDVNRIWTDTKNKELIQRKILMGQFIGYAPIEKVYGVHPSTGLLGPVGEYGDGNGLFDVPPQNVKFDRDGQPLIVTARSLRGVPVHPRKLAVFRWGSVSTPYGEGEFKNIYLATWYMQIIIDYGMKALELLGRPIPIVFIPRDTPEAKEVDDIEKSIASQFDFYLTLPTNEPRARVDMAGGNVAASGNGGRAEQEWCRYLESWIWNALINTVQTQDRGGQGNGKLEEQRQPLKDDKVAAASDAQDSFLTENFSDDVGELNWSNQPREIWPRCKSDVSEVSTAGLNGIQVEAADKQLRRLIANQVTSEQVVELLSAVGIPRNRVIRMVDATLKQRSKLASSPDIVGEGASPVADTGSEDVVAA